MPKKLAAEDGTAGGKNNKNEDNDAAGTKRHQTNGSNNSNTNYNLDLARQRPRRSSAAEKQNFPPLALLLPNAAKLSTAADNKGRRLLKGQSFVNLPPLSRIEQNALLFHSANLSSHRRVRSTEKFANYMRSSPPADSSAPRGANFGEKAAPVPYKTADDDGESDDDNDGTSSRAVAPQRAGTLRVAPGRLRHPSAASSAHSPLVGRMSVPCPSSRNSPKIIRTAAADEVPRRDRENISQSMRRSSNAADETGDGADAVTVLLEASGDAKTETAAADAFEATDARPLGGAASVCAASSSAPDKASLKSSLKVADKILRLNIGGSSYRIRTRSILKHGADTLLGRFVRMNEHHRRAWADAFFEEEEEYFFERVPRYFDPVYDFYASGKLHVPKDLCFEKFMAELRFWAVSKAKMDDCCSPFAQYCLIKKVHRFDTPEKDHFIGLRFANVRRRLWLILEGHSRSKWWKFFEITSTSFVVLSITALILASMPEFQVPDLSNQNAQGSPGTIYPTYAKATGHTISTTTVIKDGEEHRVEMVEHPVFNYVENICVVYFTLEYLLRFWVAPQKAQFVKEFLNVIDLLAICPFVFELILIFVGIRGDNVRKVR
ncbi:hypothetical protein niasHS_006432 [Heterodera schachtii]|uniref:Uncharacterized protein n=1 Tax=Heterodera schachtii TaxID=97005 RepID=A0ABD2JHC5_HETSC